MRRFKLFFFPVTLLLIFFNCSGSHENRSKDMIVAQVGKSILWKSEIDRDVPRNLSRNINLDEKKNYVRRWINTELLSQEAERRGYDHLPGIRAELKRVDKSLLANKLLEKELPEKPVISEAEAKDYYAKNKRSFVRNKNEIRLAFILLTTRKEAGNLIKRLRKGESFRKIIQKGFPVRRDPTEWDTGYIPETEVSADFAKAVKRVRIGGIVGPVKSDAGFYVLQVLDRKKAGTPRTYKEVHAKIFALLREEKMRELYHQYINSLKNKQKIIMNLKALESTQKDTIKTIKEGM
ncbi:putative parvulin-type peptidyl-prolyl cis-trans isomerase precursor [bacterium BMS3Abin05]|nr:putative parvulin-type peptidyl-prolyl cis-trans isomerase precursor [bacterium BMS3Abin05]GBE28487.1 putative parvulin-type peptidyl-prolyl cis-trans isomerase precursor [bacterium BMS3Bbin03]